MISTFVRNLFQWRLVVCLCAFALAPHASWAGFFEDDEARKAILALRQKVEAIEQARLQETKELEDVGGLKGLREENAQLKRSLLEMQETFDQLRQQLAKQTGLQEELSKDVADLQRRQRDLAQGVDERIKRFEPIKVTLDGFEFLADANEKKEFETAISFLRNSDYKSSKQALLDFLRRYPQSGYKRLGLFWLGSSQYALKDYRDAIDSFKSMLEANPPAGRASEAMLAMANSQLELKDLRAARKTLEDLVKTYPQSEAAVAAKDRLTKIK